VRFGEKSRVYAAKAMLQREVASWCAEWIEPEARGLRALELGAGPGVFTRFLAEKPFAELWASDVSAPMVEAGREALPQVRWLALDAWDLRPGGGRRLDRLYACSLLQWADEADGVLRKWRQALAGGGRFLGALFVEGSMAELLGADAGFSAVRWRSEAWWLDQFREAGFRICRWDTREERQMFGSAAAAARSMHAVGAVKSERWGAGRLRRHLRACEAAFGGEQGFPLTWRALRVEAEAMENSNGQ